MNILFLSRWFPFPPTNGSKLRIHGMLQFLCRENRVTLLSFAEPGEEVALPANTDCAEIKVVTRRPFRPESARAKSGYFSSQPRSVVATYSQEMERLVRQALAEDDYSLVIASQIDMAIYSPHFDGLPALLEEIELGVLYERYNNAGSIRGRARNGLTWLKYRRYLRHILRNFRACTVASPRERELVASIAGSSIPIEVIPNSISLEAYAGVAAAPQPETLIYTGSFSFQPNYDAMLWFTAEVFPAIRESLPAAHLVITGDHAGKALPCMEGVTLTGMVDDVRPLIASASVALAPLFTGGGSRLKILEAMALRTPVVATSKGAEGLEAEAGKHLLVADSPDDFAQAVTALLRSPERRRMLAENAYDLVRNHYENGVVHQRLAHLIEQIVSAAEESR